MLAAWLSRIALFLAKVATGVPILAVLQLTPASQVPSPSLAFNRLLFPNVPNIFLLHFSLRARGKAVRIQRVETLSFS